MSNNAVDVFPRQLSGEIVAAPTKFIELFADEGTGKMASVDEAGLITIYGLGSVDEKQIFYVGKHGSDTNSGKSNAKAKLTFPAALAAADALTPSSSNQFVIRGEDAGKYVESLDINPWVTVEAPAAIIEGNITMAGNTALQLQRLNVSSGIGIEKNSDSGHCLVTINRIACTGTATGIDVIEGVMMINGQMITHVNGNAISNTDASTASEIRGFINHITGTGTGDSLAQSGNAGNHMSLVIADMRGTGAGIDLDTGTMDLTVSNMDTATGGDVAAGTTLNLMAGDINGLSFSGGGTVNVIQASTGIVTVSNTNKASDTTRTNDATPSADPDLAIPVLANTDYVVRGTIYAISTSATPDIQIGFNVPAGATFAVGAMSARDNQTTSQHGGKLTSSGSTQNFNIAASVITIIMLDGFLSVGGTSGNLDLIWAQSNSNGSGTTLQALSYLEITPR